MELNVREKNMLQMSLEESINNLVANSKVNSCSSILHF